MRSLLVILGKDLRLLWRDRAGLVFLTLAPIVVICVAGFSLANLYGADPTGQTAYDFPVVDEDGGTLARELRERLAEETSVRFELVPDRATAEDLVRSKRAGSALVIPAGTQARVDAGQGASLILYTDPVKYLERLGVRARLLEMRDEIATRRLRETTGDAGEKRQRLEEQIERLRAAVDEARATVDAAWEEARRESDTRLGETRAVLERSREQAQREIRARLQTEVESIAGRLEVEVRRQVRDVREEVAAYLQLVETRRREFEQWLRQVERLAGGLARRMPPPPEFPRLPPRVQEVLDGPAPPLRLPPFEFDVEMPPLPPLQAPALPPRPAFDVPDIAVPDLPAAPGTLAIEEVNLGGGPTSINTFDQNVPGFSVTFLLLGMLLGVSLGLLDERDWGTYDRLRAMPVAGASVLTGKLLSRFVVGVFQMIALFAIGWLAFDVSLGPQPWALLLPIVGIVFAGTAFGLVVAAIAPSREAVLPVGSIVIVTMAAVGGCWWPIDLEPRWMRTVALAFPTTWAMDAFNDLMIRRRTFEAALRPTAVLMAYGALYLGVGLALFRRR